MTKALNTKIYVSTEKIMDKRVTCMHLKMDEKEDDDIVIAESADVHII